LPAPQLPPSEALIPQGPAAGKKFAIIPSAEPGIAKHRATLRGMSWAAAGVREGWWTRPSKSIE